MVCIECSVILILCMRGLSDDGHGIVHPEIIRLDRSLHMDGVQQSSSYRDDS